jgi:hypothetical protein
MSIRCCLVFPVSSPPLPRTFRVEELELELLASGEATHFLAGVLGTRSASTLSANFIASLE